ncbi:MAG: hypothetical protein DWQ01_00175 [Planctomycetota bacterium]|nr:MAG: hypothetical protein DWQ01_00175 [Planctomycetota bacterium]
MVEATLPAGALREAVAKLTLEKAKGAELDRGPRIPVIGDFLLAELARLEDSQFGRLPEKPPVEPLNALFRSELAEIYPGAEI